MKTRETVGNLMLCSCGAVQKTVAFSSHYQGYMFGCTKHRACRSQDEGCYQSESDAMANMVLWMQKYGLKILKADSLHQ